MTLEHVSLPGSSPTGPVWLNFPGINGTPEGYEGVYKKRADQALGLSHSYLFRGRKRDEEYGDFSTQLGPILDGIDRDKPLYCHEKVHDQMVFFLLSENFPHVLTDFSFNRHFGEKKIRQFYDHLAEESMQYDENMIMAALWDKT